MDHYSSKICTKCYSVQEPWSRFCDNCGKEFVSTGEVDGNISITTQSFMKRQVAATRPLFWLCIIIVGMLAVFGFAQAGMFRSSMPDPAVSASQKAGARSSTDDSLRINEPAAQSASTDSLDLNNSVFEMRDQATATRAPAKRALVSKLSKPTGDQVAKTDAAATIPATEAQTAPIKTEVAPVKAPEATASEPDHGGSAAKSYIRGPMGGCYYLSSSGSKRYVDRGLCN
ncbi:MAG: hypothetical protein DMF62_10105 [Acidobacteria bacterium]|nr:MAG: hypothetical protein DMF62_10105 [Acidobacteriota bacterium]